MKRIPQDQQTGLSLETIYICYRRLMLWAAQKYVSHNDCEDIVHEAFMKVIDAAEKLQQLPPRKMQMYILMIVRGTAIDFLRKEHSYLQVDMEDHVLHGLITDQGEKSVGRYGRSELFMMMRALPPDEQTLLIGKYYLGLSSKELTALVGGTDTGMRTKLHRARKKIFDEWTGSGLHMEDFLDG